MSPSDESRYHALFGASPLPTWISEEASERFVFVNEAALRRYGFTRDEFLSLSIDSLRPPGARTRRSDGPPTRLSVPAELAADRQHRRKDGTAFSVTLQVAPLQVAGVSALLTVSVSESVVARSDDPVLADAELRRG